MGGSGAPGRHRPPAEIRRATVQDIPRLLAIRAAVRENRLALPGKVTAAHCVGFMRHSDFWVYVAAGWVRGFSGGDARRGLLWALFVMPGWEGQGIGRLLLARACRSLAEAGHRRLWLTTGCGTRAEEVYRRAGWRRVKRKPGGEWVMERRLPPSGHPTPEGGGMRFRHEIRPRPAG